MKTRRVRWSSSVAIALVIGAIVWVNAGDLDPPAGPVAPTMKPLDQVEPRTPLAAATSTVTISSSGSYYLTGDIAIATGDGIVIGGDNVTLDLNGFTVSSSAASPTGSGVLLAGDRSGIHVLNGHIQG